MIAYGLSPCRSATKSKPLEVSIDTSSCPLTYLENAQAITTLSLKRGNRKDISISLLSPMGTTSTLLPHRKRDYHSDGFHEWPFMTVHSWGEDPRGEWKYTISVSSSSTEALLQKLTLVLMGTRETPRSVRNVPLSCHPECKGGCAGSGPQFCDTCKHFQLVENFECVSSCPMGTYQDHHMCRPCPNLCKHCSNMDTCNECEERAVVLSSGQCSLTCEKYTFQLANGTCQPCHHSCAECNGPEETSCTACPSQFKLDVNGRCSVPHSCLSNEYFDSRSLECRPCHESCAQCVGKGAQECTGCYFEFVLEDGVCVVDLANSKHCSPGKYYNDEQQMCTPCSLNCGKCTDDITCLSCDPGYFLQNKRVGDIEVKICVDECPKGFHGDAVSLSCESCPSYCTECVSHDMCTSCTLKFATPVNGQCPQPCHDGEYFDFDTSNCLPCLTNCKECRNPESCLACQSNFYLIADKSCVSICPEHLVEDMESHRCLSESCHESCKTCFGEEPDNCLTCHANEKFFENSCMEECPSHTYYDESLFSCHHCHNSCLSCVGPNEDNCEKCPEGKLLDHFSCVSGCPEGTFVLNGTECVSCPANCSKCSNAEKCSTCKEGFVMESEKCVQHCSQGLAADNMVCKLCPSECKECSDITSCTVCNEGRLYYRPNRSCLQSCPSGYYALNGNTCTECPSNCSECTGPSKSQCTLCSEGSAMEKETHTCIVCCNIDYPNWTPCCNCDQDHTVCVIETTPPSTVSSHTKSNSNKAGLVLSLVIVALLAAAMLGIGTYYVMTRVRKAPHLYKPLQNGDLPATLALVEDSESGTDAEVYAKTVDT